MLKLHSFNYSEALFVARTMLITQLQTYRLTILGCPRHLELAAELNFTGAGPSYHDWYVDSGSSEHVTRDQRSLSNVAASTSSSSIITASGNSLDVAAQGTLTLDKNKAIDKVLYVPGLSKNLMSVGRLTDYGPVGHFVVFDSKNCWAYPKDNPS